MGGPGSGRRRARPAVGDCRAVAIGELIDGGRWQTQRHGEVLWRAPHSAAVAGRLAYTLHHQSESADQVQLALAYRYWPAGSGVFSDDEVELLIGRGTRPVARCPECERAVRSLYAPPGARYFACRSCHQLFYRPSAWREQLADVHERAGPALAELAALPERPPTAAPTRYVAAPPAELAHRLEQELPLAPQELRLWCLRLRTCGLSYRQIAALTESSKSSIARICAAGREGIDRGALVRESLQRSATLPPISLETGRRGIAAEMRTLRAHFKRRGLYPPEFEAEERTVLP